MASIDPSKKKTYKRWTIALSVLIPFAVASLFGIKIEGYDFSFLPGIYASINGLTAILLIVALYAIKKGRVKLHRKLIGTCLILSVLFLSMYVTYHITSDAASYGGSQRSIYFSLLISHILLSILVVPLVLVTLLRALTGEFKRHRFMARITFPVWLYVAISGVLVYLMISPYY